ncbi:hypothetical protein HK101_006386 [Irineochytrium annulatum]|nr:hypothetical protein HK101_006386 [Irineochytrium annulatum]
MHTNAVAHLDSHFANFASVILAAAAAPVAERRQLPDAPAPALPETVDTRPPWLSYDAAITASVVSPNNVQLMTPTDDSDGDGPSTGHLVSVADKPTAKPTAASPASTKKATDGPGSSQALTPALASGGAGASPTPSAAPGGCDMSAATRCVEGNMGSIISCDMDMKCLCPAFASDLSCLTSCPGYSQALSGSNPQLSAASVACDILPSAASPSNGQALTSVRLKASGATKRTGVGKMLMILGVAAMMLLI